MYKKYINVVNNEITDVIFERQKDKMIKYTGEGTLVELEDVEKIEHKVNGKSISDESGVFIFWYKEVTETFTPEEGDEWEEYTTSSMKVVEKTAGEIALDSITISHNIAKAKAELDSTDGEIPRSLEDLYDTLDAENVLKKDKLPLETQSKLSGKKDKRAAYLALIG